jgi:tRNA modification GTPase
MIDRGIAIYYAAPHSYTGEDVLEMQGHGGPMVLHELLRRCLQLGARLAEPGEFTRRAFLNGKLDLAQAESVIDVIDAASSQALRCALRSLQGDFSREIERLTTLITELRASVEAMIDFPEEDVAEIDEVRTRYRLECIRTALAALLDAAQQGVVLREGIHVVLAGQPNVGKSSLLNALAGEELAIVTDIPGTTRDSIRQTINLEGIPVQISDTAGLRHTEDVVEQAGIARAQAMIARADAIIIIIDAASGGEQGDSARLLSTVPAGIPRVRVMNKIDLLGRAPSAEQGADGPVIWLSAMTGAGLHELKKELVNIAGWEGEAHASFLARERHLQALRSAGLRLGRARTNLGRMELVAEELRLAQNDLASITGAYSADDLLGEIFSKFCIGK